MCFEEQIISKEKEATIFWCKIEVIVFRILQTFCNAYCFFMGCFLMRFLPYNFMNKQVFPFSVTTICNQILLEDLL